MLKDDLLSGLKEIAEFIGEDLQVTGRMVRKGEVPAFRKGRKIYARKGEIEASFTSAAA